MLPSYSYSVYAGQRDMVSLAFFLDPLPSSRQDDTGLTHSRPSPIIQPDEPSLAKGLIDEIASIQDIDAKLSADKKLNERMFVKASKILSTLRYDLGAYRKFAFSESTY